MPTTNSSKKRTSDAEDFDIIRQYIRSCPLLPADSPALKAAMKGLDDELKRRDRDAKLQKKFAVSSSAGSAAANASQGAQGNRQEFDDEWEDIADDRKQSTVNRGESLEGDEVEFIDVEGDTSFLGRCLAETAITSIAESHVKAKNPLGAIAVALHAGMVSHTVGFVCTGTAHDKDQAKSTGFAAPIRELPKTQFLPKDWDRYASNPDDPQQQIVLRYRKSSVGSVLLRVEFTEQTSSESSGKQISVKLLPANTKELPSGSLDFSLGDHINLASWTAALRASRNSSGLEPAIHYRALPVLMTAFVKTFDFGSISDAKQESDGPATAVIGVPSAESCAAEALKRSKEFAKPLYVDNGQARGGYDRPTIDNSFPQRPLFVGDFSGDLIPGGPSSLDPLRRAGPGNAGNLMGPNHPMFQGGGISGMEDGSGFGMRPRFDPFGPPGGPQEIHPPLGPGGRPVPHLRPRGSGEPNPDHPPPPNSLGGNMFS